MASTYTWHVAALVLLLAVSLTSASRDLLTASTTVVAVYGQCGGKGGKCADYNHCLDSPFKSCKCEQDLSCTRVNEWHWECRKPDGKHKPDEHKPEKKTIPVWGQCGGKGGICAEYKDCHDSAFGRAYCEQGTTCQRRNEWHYQCEPVKTDPPKVVPKYGQCGGMGGNCTDYKDCHDSAFNGYACESGTTCKRQNEWYWQCLEPVKPQPKKVIYKYGQCGGKGGNCADYKNCHDSVFDGFCCEDGSTCQRKNEWYWQCL
eukprot:gene9093-9263_t